ncbi:Phosphoribosylformylglycinamidine cyclo-ligase [Botrimarina colliarenosi]|uniref:Phosphoribosylformylglycinamidine cyclo-ligase n=1 Tax=Botrimarina colliarenosi TaxID=2528001 RepID=A0A5C6AH76_9BACT|nr:phosphoribosylformylglycinamidine cyclo-ligase [Botrimarina colliarenosi]TWT99392.1 Phosphoribosylformylglycinamidine cyclo-ligase [Botrimarina colliarenosi]
MALSYKDAGVDLDVYEESMSRLPRLMRRTHTPRVMPLEGGFAGLFRLDFAGKLFARQYRDPVLVSCTDGVGTKLKVAQMVGRHDTVGVDLVAMCVNDALCCGAEPLFFLDYIAMGKDDPERLEQVVSGISDGCVSSDSALIGGETAIMPDLYGPDDYDLAGFSVGVVERHRLIDGAKIGPGDVVIGIASSGLHSNGYSLVRKIVFEAAGLSPDDTVAECDGATVADLLLTPTRIYTVPVRRVLGHYRKKQVVHGIAHITGGGLRENLERILPTGVSLAIDEGSWPVPPVFTWLQKLGDVADDEMARVFNCGVGLAMVVSEHFAESIASQLTELGLDNWVIGRIS